MVTNNSPLKSLHSLLICLWMLIQKTFILQPEFQTFIRKSLGINIFFCGRAIYALSHEIMFENLQ